MPKKKGDGQAAKIKWVIKNYFEKGKSRPEAVKGLMEKFGCVYNYARTIVYNHLCYLDWKRAPYPENRKKRKTKKDDLKKEKLKEKFKPVKPKAAKEKPDEEVENDFDF